MADGGQSLISVTDEDLVCCSICLEEYDDPRALPCLHSFCYKCLVQLSGELETEAASCASLVEQLDPLKSDGTNYSLEDEQEEDNVSILRCPLCSEEHPIPVIEGIDGFRKDFRINTLVQQKKLKSFSFEPIDVLKIKKDNVDEQLPIEEVVHEKCIYHPSENLRYFCENEACQADICNECWGSKHDNHIVQLLSTKVSTVKDSLEQELENNAFQVSSQIEILAETKDEMEEYNKEVLHDIKEKHTDNQKQLLNAYQDVVEKMRVNQVCQEKKMSDELLSLTSLLETLKQIRAGLHGENVQPTSNLSLKYLKMKTKIQTLIGDSENWNFPFTQANLQKFEQKVDFQIPDDVEYEETSIDQILEGEEEEEDDEYYEEDEDYENEEYSGDEYDDQEYDENEEVEENYDEDDAYHMDEEAHESDDSEAGAEAVQSDKEFISCTSHPDEGLQFRCGTCNMDICQQCWSSTHESHVVKLISMNFEDVEVKKKEIPTVQIRSRANNYSRSWGGFRGPTPMYRPPPPINWQQEFGHPIIRPILNFQLPQQPRPQLPTDFRPKINVQPQQQLIQKIGHLVTGIRAQQSQIRYLRRSVGRGRGGTSRASSSSQNVSRAANNRSNTPSARGPRQPSIGSAKCRSGTGQTKANTPGQTRGNSARGRGVAGRGNRGSSAGGRGVGRGGSNSNLPKPKPNQTTPGKKPSRPPSGGRGRGGGNQRGGNRGGSNQGGSNRGRSNQGGSNRGGSNQGGSNRGGGNRGGAKRGGSSGGGGNRGRGGRGSQGAGKKGK